MIKTKKVKQMNVGSPTHILKLLNKVNAELNNEFYAMDARKIFREALNVFGGILDDMEDKDEEFQNLPENRIKNLKAEMEQNDVQLKKHKEEYHLQVQLGMFKKGMSQSSPMYNTLIERMEFEIEEDQIKVDSELSIVSPIFTFQMNKRWAEIQLEMFRKKIAATKKNLKEIKQNVEEVKNDLTAQKERMKNRRVQIIEELKGLGEDISELKKKTLDYIN